MNKIIKFFKDLGRSLELLYLSNPILNPAVVKIQPFTHLTRLKTKKTKYRLMVRDHLFDRWRSEGDFKSFKAAMEASLK